jgi:Ti-type conjugative transfer relaxase TraA
VQQARLHKVPFCTALWQATQIKIKDKLEMALYHFSVKALSRGTRSTVRAVAYRAGCDLQDVQTGETFSYTKKDVVYVELLLPQEAPPWIRNIQTLIHQDRQCGVQMLVDKVEAAEKRINSRVWREVEFALPRELSHEQNIALAKEFVQDQLCSRGMVALLNFHFDVDQKTGEEKPHCHVLLTTRSLGEDGFEAKAREWNSRELLYELREQWAAYSNFHLKLLGHDVQIDHRSYYERGIEIEPQPKQGKNVVEQENRLGKLGVVSPTTDKGKAFQDIQFRNLYRILRHPEVVFEIVSKHHATFLWDDVQKVLHRYVDDLDLFQKMETRLMGSKELVLLSPEWRQREEGAIYTTRSLLKAEKALVETAESLDKSKSHGVDTTSVTSALKKGNQTLKDQGFSSGLSKDQIKAIHHFVDAGQLKCAVGIAGAGKTTALGICQDMWKLQGYAVYGIAPTGKAAQNLSQSGISSMTLHKFLKSFEEGRCQYNSKTVLVLDEAGMVDVERFSKLLHSVNKLNVKLVVVGDGAQLQPVEAGPAFRLITERIGKSELTTVLRQNTPWQQEATRLFGKQQTKEAIQTYQQRGNVQIVEEKIPSLTTALEVKDTEALKQLHGLSTYIAPRMYREIVRDAEKGHTSLNEHRDYIPYLKWKKIQEATAGYTSSTSSQKVDVRKDTKGALLEAWHKDFKAHPSKDFLMLTFRNKDVDDLNAGARFLLKQSGHISKEEVSYKTAKETENDFGKRTSIFTTKGFSKGDRIVFTRNNHSLNVKNGMLGTIVGLNKALVAVKLENEERTLSFAPALNPFFDHGWAVTIHKSQGTTTDRTYVLASYDMTQNLTYVAMTRHREDVYVFGGSLDFWRTEKLPDILASSGEKLAARDYLDADSLEQLMKQEDKLLDKVFTRLSDELEAMGAVSKHVFWKVTDTFLGRAQEKETKPTIDLPRSIREETRAEKILSQKGYKGFWRDSSSKEGLPSAQDQGYKEERGLQKKRCPSLWRDESGKKSSTLGRSTDFQQGLTPNSDSSPNKNLEAMSAYIKDRLHNITTYAGTHLSRKAFDELHNYMTTLEKNTTSFQALQEHNYQLMKEVDKLLKEQEYKVAQNHEKGKDFGI